MTHYVNVSQISNLNSQTREHKTKREKINFIFSFLFFLCTRDYEIKVSTLKLHTNFSNKPFFLFLLFSWLAGNFPYTQQLQI